MRSYPLPHEERRSERSGNDSRGGGTRHQCALDYTEADCPMPALACKVKIETDHNRSDLASIGLIELGTRDINVDYGDGDMDIRLDDFEEESE